MVTCKGLFYSKGCAAKTVHVGKNFLHKNVSDIHKFAKKAPFIHFLGYPKGYKRPNNGSAFVVLCFEAGFLPF